MTANATTSLNIVLRFVSVQTLNTTTDSQSLRMI